MNCIDIKQMSVNEILDMSLRDFCEIDCSSVGGLPPVPVIGEHALETAISDYFECYSDEITVEKLLKFGRLNAIKARHVGNKTITVLQDRMEIAGIDWNTRRIVEEQTKPVSFIEKLASSATNSDMRKRAELDARIETLERQIMSDMTDLFGQDKVNGDVIERGCLIDQILHEIATYRELEHRLRIANVGI